MIRLPYMYLQLWTKLCTINSSITSGILNYPNVALFEQEEANRYRFGLLNLFSNRHRRNYGND